ncbi:MAG: biotin/lipoate--protein ligase family protein [Pseudomonadota bacterium]
MLGNPDIPRELLLPPPYTAHWLGHGDVFAEAQRLAPDEGAGCLVWQQVDVTGGPGRFDFAVVLEPDTPLEAARRAFLVGMVAISEALAAHCPPERSVEIRWPGEILLDRSRLGGMRFASAPETAADQIPDWLVLGVELIADRDHLTMPGDRPDSISLKEEEFTDPPAVLESFCSYLMLNFDRWKHDGFEAIARRYDERVVTEGVLTDLGDLVVDGDQTSLAAMVAQPHWRDDIGPKL